MNDIARSLQPNTVLSDYKIEGILGQGGFGITYLATDINLNYKVAIKEYYPREYSVRDNTLTIHAVGNKEDKDTFYWGLTRFLEESRTLAKLSHPNIIAVKRYFQANGTAYLVMDYCDGKPLDEIIKNNGPLDENKIKKILFPLLDGLEHVHKNDFLHRDIKPANIFIKNDGTPVLLDFGAARHEMTNYSKSVTSLATAGYAPFEQYSTKGKQGPWSDIYGLAATIYRAATGEKPQDSPDRMLEDQLVPLVERLDGKFPKNLLIALDAALSVRPDMRPQNIDNFRAMLTPSDKSLKTKLSNNVEKGKLNKNSKTQAPNLKFIYIGLGIVAIFSSIFFFKDVPISSMDTASNKITAPQPVSLSSTEDNNVKKEAILPHMEDGKSEGPIKDTQKSAPQAVITSSNANQKQTSKETYNQNDKIKPTSSKTVNELNRLEFSVTPSPAGAKEEKQKKPTDINNIQ